MSSDIERAEEARQRGNTLYKARRFSKAIEAYKEAAALVPSDLTPLSNLSAATFEAGDYEKSVQYATEALTLLEKEVDDDPRKQKLLTRLTKAKRYHTDPDESIAKETLRKATLRLPRYRPFLTNERSYFACGHDIPESQYGSTLQETTKDADVVSIMFCGIGDARNMLQTMVHYFMEGPQSSESDQRLHFTILDFKPAILARDLILFSLLDDIALAIDSQDPSLFEMLSVGGYFYATQVMPAYASNRIEAIIKRLLDSFDRSGQPIPWVYIPVAVQAALRPSLEAWIGGQTASYSTKRFRELTREDNMLNDMRRSAVVPNPEAYSPFAHLKADKRIYEDLTVVLPDPNLIIQHDPELDKLLEAYFKTKNNKNEKARVSAHIDSTWKPNITLADITWEKENSRMPRPDLTFTPFEVMANLMKGCMGEQGTSPACGERLMNVVEFYFVMVGKSISGLRERMLVEVCLGEMSDCLEKLQYQTLARATETESKDCLVSSKWPHKYHVIHMSNIPDYVGGPLTSFLYGTPLLEHGPGTGVVSCNLRNSRSFTSLSQFLAEYLLMYDRKLIESHFHLRLSSETPESAADPMPSMRYSLWERIRPPKALSFEPLMPHSKFLHWLYAHFLKICVPSSRARGDNGLGLIFAPLNLTAFVRLLKHVSELGYPTHWISNLIDSIFSGQITTTARPPPQQIFTMRDVDTIHPSRSFCTRPWLLEFTTLTGLWRSLLPIGLVLPSYVPRVEDIVSYTVKFPDLDVWDGQVPHSMLVFHDEQTFGESPKHLRPLLIDDVSDSDSKLYELRDKGLRCMSTFHLNVEAREVTFWMSKDALEEMKEWNVSVWRTDVWEQEDKGLKLGDAIIKQMSWEEWKDCQL